MLICFLRFSYILKTHREILLKILILMIFFVFFPIDFKNFDLFSLVSKS